MSNEPPMHHRSIRSYVLRQGRMTSGQRRAFDVIWPRWGVPAGTAVGNGEALFGGIKPLVLEIGFGMGEALADMAARFPDTHFIGVDVHKPGVGHVLQLIEDKGLSNLRIFCADANHVLSDSIADDSLDGVQIFFPDPWRKRAHHKRRLVQNAFLDTLRQKLKVGGFVHLATDWSDYADHMQAVLMQAEHFTKPSEAPADIFQRRSVTKFEQRGKRLGHMISEFYVKRVR